MVHDYCTTLFTTSNPPCEDDISGLVHTKVTAEERAWLDSPYTGDEIHVALKDMNPQKAPGPDGLTAQFFQQFWGEIKIDVLRFCLDILNRGASVQEVNRTFIALIPKVSNADSMRSSVLSAFAICYIRLLPNQSLIG